MRFSLNLLFIVGVVSSTSSNCDPGWSTYDGGKSCYKLFTHSDTKDIIHLFQLCLENDSVPASIYNAFDNAFLVKMVKDWTITGMTWTPDRNFSNYDGTPARYVSTNWYYYPEVQSNAVVEINADGEWGYDLESDRLDDPILCERPIRAAKTCPTGFQAGPKTAAGESCYYVGYNADWYTADADCSSKGAKLASIHSADENYYLRELLSSHVPLPDNLQVWLGGAQFAGQWMWEDFTPMDYTKWGSTNGTTNIKVPCIAFRADNSMSSTNDLAGQWFPYDCRQTQRAYVCKVAPK